MHEHCGNPSLESARGSATIERSYARSRIGVRRSLQSLRSGIPLMIVFVTGASAGFGAAIARSFVKGGHRVVATARPI